MWLYFLIIVGVVALDQASKWLVLLNMELHESVPLIQDVLHFTYVRNPGAAFGSFSGARWIFLVISVVGIAAVLFYLVKFKPKEWYMSIPLSMIAGGGIGNMIDRLFYGESFGNGTVVDFIDFCAFPRLWHWIFNVADIFVVVGAFTLFVYLLIDVIKEFKNPTEEKKNG